MRFSSSRVFRFVRHVAWEFVPDVVAKPVNIATHFYDCFLAVESSHRQQLLAEAQRLNDQDAEALTDHLLEVMRGQTRMPGDPRPLVLQFLQALRQAGSAGQNKQDLAEALRQSLNHGLLSHSGQTIAPRNLSAQQKAVGGLLTSCLLAGDANGRPPSASQTGDLPAIPGHEILRLLGQGGFSNGTFLSGESIRRPCLVVGRLGRGQKSGLTTSPPAGVTSDQNTDSLTDGAIVRTLPSNSATVRPAWCGV